MNHVLLCGTLIYYILTSSGLASSSALGAGSKGSWKKYKTASFEINHPGRWPLHKIDSASFVLRIDVDEQRFHRSDYPDCILLKKVMVDTTKYNLDGYVTDFIMQHKSNIKGFNSISRELQRRAGEDCLESIFAGEMNSYLLKWRIWTWLKDGYIYQLIYVADGGDYAKYAHRAERVMKSFRFRE